MSKPCKAAMVAGVGLGHLLDDFEDSRWPSSLSLRFRRVPVDGWMWRSTEAEAIYRQTPRSKGVANRPWNRLGRLAWADQPRPVSARFDPVSLSDASRSIIDLVPSACGPLTSCSPRFRWSSLSRKLQHILFRSLEFYAFTLWSLGHLKSCSPRVLTCVGLHDLRTKCSLNFSRKCFYYCPNLA
jgi:hypothetical protein